MLTSLPAFAFEWSIWTVPDKPTTNDPVIIRIGGVWPNACIPQNPQVTLAGNQIRIATSSLGQNCAQVLTRFDITASVGRLAAGSYLVTATHNGQSIGSLNFTVTGGGGGNPPPGGCDLRAVITTNRGCGATYQIGEGIVIQFRAESATYSQAFVTLDDVLPTGAVNRLYQGTLPTNQTFQMTGSIAPPTGQETLRITAQAGTCAGSGSCSFMVGSDPTPPGPTPPVPTPPGSTLTVTPTTVSPGSALTAAWSGIASPPSRIWLGLYRTGSADGQYLSYWFTNGVSSGRLSVTLPANLSAGAYELRMFPSGSYTRLATSNVFTVGSAPTAGEFIVNVLGERFVIRLATAEQIATARAILAGTQPQRIVFGQLADGNGGYNFDHLSGRVWSWRLVPETITFVEITPEIYDGRPSEVERNRNYWLYTLGRFGPWAGVLEGEVVVN
jgi:hypothetical protein